MGYSSRIEDPAFEQYLKNKRKWSLQFSLILAAAAVLGFYIYGAVSPDMDNPQAVLIGAVIGLMFTAIGLNAARKNKSKTWDGVVTDKKVEQKRRRNRTGNSGYYWEEYILFTVFISDERGKIHTISVENDDTLFNYYKIGDRVRHHGRLNTYEKYDKTGDSIVFCNACASLNEIKEDYCFRCNCPLLK